MVNVKMQPMKNFFRASCLAALLLVNGAWAALPDPVEFAWAVESDNRAKIREWLDEGLNPEFQGNQIGSGLMIAAWNGNIPLMALFVERGANPRRANQNGEQALQLAAWNGHLEAVKWLLDHGAAINRDGKYWGALHYAVFNGHSEIARYLIGRGAQINATSPNGSTPLMMAAREGREDLAKLLIDSGADPKAKNDWGDSALTLAMRYDHYHLGKMISTAEEFAVAVKAPKESFGEASRSAAVPSEIDALLRQLREAEAARKPTDELRRKLMLAVDDFRRNATPIKTQRRTMPLPYQPGRSIVITAKRGQPGTERAQMVSKPQKAAPAKKDAPGTIRITPSTPRPTAGQVADLSRRIRLAEAAGQPTEELKKQLFEAIEQMK